MVAHLVRAQASLAAIPAREWNLLCTMTVFLQLISRPDNVEKSAMVSSPDLVRTREEDSMRMSSAKARIGVLVPGGAGNLLEMS